MAKVCLEYFVETKTLIRFGRMDMCEWRFNRLEGQRFREQGSGWTIKRTGGVFWEKKTFVQHGCLEMLMAKNFLEGSDGNAGLDGMNGKSMPEHHGGHAINHSADRSRHLDRVCGNNVCPECIGVWDQHPA